MDTTRLSQWKPIDCKALATIGVPAGFGCGLYRSIGPAIGSVTDYRYIIAPDRSSLTVRSDAGQSTDVRLSADVNLGYELELRSGDAVRSCGDPAHDFNPATGKNDYLHLRLHELLRLRPTSDYGLRASFAHSFSADAACKIAISPLMRRDLTSNIIAFEDRLLNTAEDRVKQKVVESSSGLQAGMDRGWRRLQRPITVASPFGAYQVLLHPSSAALSLLETSGGANQELVTGSIVLGVSPEIRTDLRKSSPIVARPPLGFGAADFQSDHLNAVATVGYAYASGNLRKRLIGRRLRYGPLASVEVTDAAVFPTLSQSKMPQLAIETRYRGTVRGSLFAWGTPTYDVRTDRLSVQDLQLTPEPKGFVGRVALAFVHRRSVLEVAQKDTDIRPNALFAKLVSPRSLAINAGSPVVLSGSLKRVTLDSIALTRTGITAGVRLHGNVKLRAHFSVDRILGE